MGARTAQARCESCVPQSQVALLAPPWIQRARGVRRSPHPFLQGKPPELRGGLSDRGGDTLPEGNHMPKFSLSGHPSFLEHMYIVTGAQLQPHHIGVWGGGLKVERDVGGGEEEESGDHPVPTPTLTLAQGGCCPFPTRGQCPRGLASPEGPRVTCQCRLARVHPAVQ